jgi:hypothetical protein
MARRRGPAPEPGSLGDSRYGGTGAWVDVPDIPRDLDTVPPLPEWIAGTLKSPATISAYEALARLPQAAVWTAGDWLIVHLSMPLLDRYLTRPGSESYKALLAGLGSGPGLTTSDLLKLHRRLVNPEATEAEDDAPRPRRRLVAVDQLPSTTD